LYGERVWKRGRDGKLGLREDHIAAWVGDRLEAKSATWPEGEGEVTGGSGMEL